MTDKELKGLYATACKAKGFEPNDGQFKVWKQTLGWSEEADLARAITWWFTEQTTFPMPAELKPLIWRASREREAQSSVKRYMVNWKCPVCAHTKTGYLEMQERGLRYCPGIWGPLLPIDAPRIKGQRPERTQLPAGTTCGHEMTIMNDERLASA